MHHIEGPDLKLDPDTDVMIDPICDTEQAIAYGLYAKLRIYVHHYNTLKVKYKLIAASWLFATFIGLGYIFSGEEAGLPISSMIASGFVSFLSASGICFLWFLDVGIYHRILAAIFTEKIRLEQKYPQLLSSVGNNIIALARCNVKDPAIWYDSLYYAISSFVLFLMGIASFGAYFFTEHPKLVIVAVLTIGIIAFIAEIAFIFLVKKIENHRVHRYLHKKNMHQQQKHKSQQI